MRYANFIRMINFCKSQLFRSKDPGIINEVKYEKQHLQRLYIRNFERRYLRLHAADGEVFVKNVKGRGASAPSRDDERRADLHRLVEAG